MSMAAAATVTMSGVAVLVRIVVAMVCVPKAEPRQGALTNRIHAGFRPSEVLGDFLELFHRAPLLARQRSDGVFQAMVDVVLDERLLGLTDRLLDGVELLGNVEARPSRFDHVDHASKMPLGSLQPLYGVGMGLMENGL
jgi:hypothetical protein